MNEEYLARVKAALWLRFGVKWKPALRSMVEISHARGLRAEDATEEIGLLCGLKELPSWTAGEKEG